MMWNKLYSDHADVSYHSPRTRQEAEALRDQLRATGEFRRVEVQRFNNGSRARPIDGYKVLGWKK